MKLTYLAAAIAALAIPAPAFGGATPKELLFGPHFKGPATIEIGSDHAQFAGRTTISSGSATATVSTAAVNSDSIFNVLPQVALAAAYATRGVVSIDVGTHSCPASTTAVYSGQSIELSIFGPTDQASGRSRAFRTNSIVDGTSFAITTVDGANVTSGPQFVHWRLPEAIPQGIKVNTIGKHATNGNGFVTFGWADGRARPVDVTLHWQLLKTG